MTNTEQSLELLNEFFQLSSIAAQKELAKLRGKAEKKFKETYKRIEIVYETGKAFKENVAIESSTAMDKYSHKIFERIQETFNAASPPEKFNLHNLQRFSDDFRKELADQDEVLIKYVSLLKGSKYAKKVKQLSKSLQKMNKELTNFERFTNDDYAPQAEIENNELVIWDTIGAINNYTEKLEALDEFETSIIERDLEITTIKLEYDKVANHPKKVQFKDALRDFNTLQKQLEARFSNIRKALRKYENLIAKSKTKGDTTLLRKLIKDVTGCLADQSSVSGIDVLLRDLDFQLENTNLKLKRDKREAARKDIKELLNGGLKEIFDTATMTRARRDHLATNLKELELDQLENRLRSSLNGLKRDRNRVLEREIRELEQIEGNIAKFIDDVNSRISGLGSGEMIKLELPGIPKWALLLE